MIYKIKIIALLIILFSVSCTNHKDEYINEEIEDTIPNDGDTQYATWIMIWDRSSESWWNSENTVGATIWVNGKWQSIDWRENSQIDEFIQNIKDAGINILICDLTNGWNWLDEKVQYIQSLCAKNGMKVCVAENSQGNISTFENHARDIWNNFAKPDLPNSSTYLIKDGKPVIVCYAIREWYNAYKNSNGNYTKKFNLVWASGEDSDKDKWGWQLEPWVGSIPSQDAMFVTSSVKWSINDEDWRKSLAFLDYNFLLAKQNHPNYIIVGSYDDIHERNSWLVANTINCIHGRQMRDKNGVISIDAYYNRVKEWIEGNPSLITGGYIIDGCYWVINKGSGKFFNFQGSKGKVGTPLIQKIQSSTGLADYYWFYHLGDNNYRIISLTSGLSLDLNNKSILEGDTIIHNMDDNVLTQKWTLEDAGDNCFYIKNNFSNMVLQPKENSNAIIQSIKTGNLTQKWEIKEININNHFLNLSYSTQRITTLKGCGM